MKQGKERKREKDVCWVCYVMFRNTIIIIILDLDRFFGLFFFYRFF